MVLSDRVLRTIRRHAMVPPGGRIVVALSGGGDSVALVHLLLELARRGECVVAGVAHFNHQLRDAADADEAFCRSMAADLGVGFEVDRADVRAVARDQKRSVEDAGRLLRYRFLAEAAGRMGAAAIAVGHTLDDQAETFLLRLLRGAGTRGLGSIRPKAGQVIRPLIEVRRAELRHYAANRGLRFQEDETNADVAVPRNRVRHALLPYLEREFSPAIVEVLGREAALAKDDDDRLEQEAIVSAAAVVLTDTPSGLVTLDAGALTALHPAIASRVARRALEPLAGGRFLGFDDIARLLELARTGRPGQCVSLPGQQARVCAAAGGLSGPAGIELGPEPSRPVRRAGGASGAPGPGDGAVMSLPVPGEVTTSHWRVGAEWSDRCNDTDGAHGLVRGLSGSLAVRFRRPGDRFQPPGMGGRSRKLQDYLVDRKVARAERDRLPLVVDQHDRIVWVVGHGIAEEFRAPEPSPGVILLKAKRLGGEG